MANKKRKKWKKGNDNPEFQPEYETKLSYQWFTAYREMTKRSFDALSKSEVMGRTTTANNISVWSARNNWVARADKWQADNFERMERLRIEEEEEQHRTNIEAIKAVRQYFIEQALESARNMALLSVEDEAGAHRVAATDKMLKYAGVSPPENINLTLSRRPNMKTFEEMTPQEKTDLLMSKLRGE